jgi:hypothetical protein
MPYGGRSIGACRSDAEQWLFRAEEMRTVAADMHDQHCKEMALRLAEGYERLAHQAERITEDRAAARR